MGLENYPKFRVLDSRCNQTLEYWIDNEFRLLDPHCNQNLEYWINNVVQREWIPIPPPPRLN